MLISGQMTLKLTSKVWWLPLDWFDSSMRYLFFRRWPTWRGHSLNAVFSHFDTISTRSSLSSLYEYFMSAFKSFKSFWIQFERYFRTIRVSENTCRKQKNWIEKVSNTFRDHTSTSMKVAISKYHGVATWHWDVDDECCGICRMPFDACCPDCKVPGDGCPPGEWLGLG